LAKVQRFFFFSIIGASDVFDVSLWVELAGKGKVKSLYLTPVVSSVTRLVSMEADGAPFKDPPASVSAPFYGYSKLWLHGSEESRNRRCSH